MLRKRFSLPGINRKISRKNGNEVDLRVIPLSKKCAYHKTVMGQVPSCEKTFFQKLYIYYYRTYTCLTKSYWFKFDKRLRLVPQNPSCELFVGQVPLRDYARPNVTISSLPVFHVDEKFTHQVIYLNTKSSIFLCEGENLHIKSFT